MTQTGKQDYAILVAIIIVLCGCVIIATVFGDAGSLFAGIVFGASTGFGGAIWALRPQFSPRTFERQPEPRAERPEPSEYQRVKSKYEQENVSPVDDKW